MHIIILGAGISGISSAYYLQQQGHQVTVIDRAAGAALETSYANAGQLSYGYTTPWAAPSIPLKALKWLMRKHSPLIIRPDGSAYQLRWLGKMLHNCSARAYALNKERMVRLSEYSRALFQQFKQEHTFDFEGREQGTIQIFHNDKEIKAAQEDIKVLRDYGVPYQELSAEACLQYEPALKSALPHIAGALRLPQDQTGDCYLFTRHLAEYLAQKGVKFIWHTEIDHIETQNQQIEALRAGEKRFQADAYLCALGSFSRPVLQALQLDVPIYPVKGYSLTVPIVDESRAPQSTVIDETYKVALTRFAQRIRVGGMAELSGYHLALPPQHRETLELVVNLLFPEAGDLQAAEYWTGLRPMTPDSTPIVGGSAYRNLYLNCGHGTLGWTMSLGSGRLIADIISEKTPEIRHDDLALSRYRA